MASSNDRSMAGLLGAFIASVEVDALPAAVVEKARCTVLYGFGMAACGNEALREIPRALGRAAAGAGTGPATLLLDGSKAPVKEAIVVNTAAFHARPQSDTMGTTHFGVMLLPLLLAMAEAHPERAAEFLPALVAGYEAGGALEKDFAALSSVRGFRASTLYGTVAAAAAAARMMRLGPERAAAAVAIAASFAGGILQTFEDDGCEWQFQAGIAAQNGLFAAELAAAGTAHARHAFEGRFGLLPSFAGVEPGAAWSPERLGSEWSIHRVTFKPYPVCTLCQTPALAALELRERLGGRTIASLRVRMHPLEADYPGVARNTGVDSYSSISMSAPYCVARMLCGEGLSLSSLMQGASDRAGELCARIAVLADAAVPPMSCIMEGVAEDGRPATVEKYMTERDYDFDRERIASLIRTCGREEGVDDRAYDHLERFVGAAPDGDVGDVVSAFGFRRA